MSDDFDDLLAPPRRRPGRPTNAEREARRAAAEADVQHQAELRKAATGHHALTRVDFGVPVPQQFLADVLHMDPATVKKRLRRCKPAAVISNRPVWYFHEAIQFLVKPKMTAEEFARSLNKADLPPEINKSFWDSQRSRVKYKIEAQEAWETEDVLQVLGKVAMTMKDSLVMVVEELRNRAKLTDEQTVIVQECIDEIRSEIRRELLELPAQTATGSMHAKPLFGVSGDIETDPELPEDGWWDAEDDGEDDA